MFSSLNADREWHSFHEKVCKKSSSKNNITYWSPYWWAIKMIYIRHYEHFTIVISLYGLPIPKKKEKKVTSLYGYDWVTSLSSKLKESF